MLYSLGVSLSSRRGILAVYLAPLNYDRFLKKVFSDTSIAKRFLEDFLAIEIQELEVFGTDG